MRNFKCIETGRSLLQGVSSNVAPSRRSQSAAAQAVGCLAASAEVSCHEANASSKSVTITVKRCVKRLRRLARLLSVAVEREPHARRHAAAPQAC